MFNFTKNPNATEIHSLAKTSDNWPILKVPANNLLEVLYTQTEAMNDQKSNEANIRVLFFKRSQNLPNQTRLSSKYSPPPALHLFQGCCVCLKALWKVMPQKSLCPFSLVQGKVSKLSVGSCMPGTVGGQVEGSG